MKIVERCTDILRFGLVLVLVYSSADHLINPYRFAGTIANYKLFPSSLSIVFATCIPLWQLGLAFALFCEKLAVIASWLASAMFFIFFLTQLIVLIQGRDVSCGFFGDIGTKIGPVSLSVTGSMFIGSVLLAIIYGRRKQDY